MKALILSLIMTFSAHAQLHTKTDYYYLVIGQSNMERANTDYAPATSPWAQTSDSDILIFNTSNDTFETWDMTTSNQNTYIGAQDGTPEHSLIPFWFGKRFVQELPNKRIHFICSTLSGQSLNLWGAFGATHDPGKAGWRWIVDQLQYVPYIDGILFQQGETTQLGGTYTDQERIDYHTLSLQTLINELYLLDKIDDEVPFLASELTPNPPARENRIGEQALINIDNDVNYPQFVLVPRPSGSVFNNLHWSDNQCADLGFHNFWQSYITHNPQGDVIVLTRIDNQYTVTWHKGDLYTSTDLLNWEYVTSTSPYYTTNKKTQFFRLK